MLTSSCTKVPPAAVAMIAFVCLLRICGQHLCDEARLKLFMIIGLLLICTGVYILGDRLVFLGEAANTTGTVVDIVSGISSRLVIQFSGKDNNVVQFKSRSSSSYAGYRRGDEVPVLYAAGKPEKAFLDSKYALFFPLIPIFIIGAAFVAFPMVWKYISNLEGMS